MEHNLCKKEFYKLMLRDRLPVASIQFPLERKNRKIEFFTSPMGLIILASIGKNAAIDEIKMYDERRSRYTKLNLFCGDNIVCIEDGMFVCTSCGLQIEDIIGKNFLIKIGDQSIIARAHMLPMHRAVDKSTRLVYN